jgi:two-component system sensor histidine kinase/response regulator
MNIEPQKNIILIIDDNATNIGVLIETLKAQGFETITARHGAMGIRRAQFSQPNLILLDIKMPEMDGYEVCKRLKADEQTRHIPVIFISALSETFDKVKAFSVGGVDYVTKPFQEEEVLARVKTHLVLQSQKKQLQTQAEELRQANKQLQTQAEELRQANEQLVQLNQEKNEFLGIAAHDLKNPLAAILTLVQMIEKSIEASAFASKVTVIEFAHLINISAEHMFNIIINLLEVNTIESGKIRLNLEKSDILDVLREIVFEYTQKAKRKNITVHFTPTDSEYIAYVDINMVRQVLDNLLSNAVKYSPFGKNVYLRIFTKKAAICCEIQDEGPGLCHEEQPKLFKKFSRLSPVPTDNENSTGLGLFIVKKLVNAMGGKVWCESKLGVGSKFVVEFMVEER